jgi:hypothetical protein
VIVGKDVHGEFHREANSAVGRQQVQVVAQPDPGSTVYRRFLVAPYLALLLPRWVIAAGEADGNSIDGTPSVGDQIHGQPNPKRATTPGDLGYTKTRAP